jgi:hypothetical protein
MWIQQIMNYKDDNDSYFFILVLPIFLESLNYKYHNIYNHSVSPNYLWTWTNEHGCTVCTILLYFQKVLC